MVVNVALLVCVVGVAEVDPLPDKKALVRYSIPAPVPLYSNIRKKYWVAGANPVRKKLDEK